MTIQSPKTMHEKKAPFTTITTTIQFNVGGKLYEISETLLKKYPHTVLAHKALFNEASTTMPIFLDRDPDRFAYCLDYMRRNDGSNNKVHLPETVSKEAVLNELQFFGFADIDEEAFVEENNSTAKTAAKFQKILAECYDRMAFQEKEIVHAHENIAQLQNKITDRNADIEEHRKQIQLEMIALRCFKTGVDTVNVDFHVGLTAVEVTLLSPPDKQARFASMCEGLGLGETLYNRNQSRVEFKKLVN